MMTVGTTSTKSVTSLMIADLTTSTGTSLITSTGTCTTFGTSTRISLMISCGRRASERKKGERFAAAAWMRVQEEICSSACLDDGNLLDDDRAPLVRVCALFPDTPFIANGRSGQLDDSLRLTFCPVGPMVGRPVCPVGSSRGSNIHERSALFLPPMCSDKQLASFLLHFATLALSTLQRAAIDGELRDCPIRGLVWRVLLGALVGPPSAWPAQLEGAAAASLRPSASGTVSILALLRTWRREAGLLSLVNPFSARPTHLASSSRRRGSASRLRMI